MIGVTGLTAPGPRMDGEPYSPQGVWYRPSAGAQVATDTDPQSGRLYSENARLTMTVGTVLDSNNVYAAANVGALAGGPNHSGDGKPVFRVPTSDHPRQPVFHFGSFPGPSLQQLPTSWATGATYKGLGALTTQINKNSTVTQLLIDSLQQTISGSGQDIYVCSPDGLHVDHYTTSAGYSPGAGVIGINGGPTATADFPVGSIIFHNPFSGMIQYYLQSVPVPLGLDPVNKISTSSPSFNSYYLDRILASGGSDAAITIWDPWHDEIWEFWKFTSMNTYGIISNPTTGSAQTTLSINVNYPLPAGTYTLRDYLTGSDVDTFTTTAPAAAGNSTVSITSHTFAHTFPAGSLIGAQNQSTWTDNAHVYTPPGFLAANNDGWYYAAGNAAYMGPKLAALNGSGSSVIRDVMPHLPYLGTLQDSTVNVPVSWGATAIDTPRDAGKINPTDIKRGSIDHALKIYGQCGGPNGPSGVSVSPAFDSSGKPQVAACPSGQPTTRWDSVGVVQTQGAQNNFQPGPQLAGTLSTGNTTSIAVTPSTWPAGWGSLAGAGVPLSTVSPTTSLPIAALTSPLGNLPATPVAATTLNGAPGAFPVASIALVNAGAFPTTGGVVAIAGVAGMVQFTSKTGNTLTGCSGGSGSPSNGAAVTLAYGITDLAGHTDTFVSTATVNLGATAIPIVSKTFNFAFTTGAKIVWPVIPANNGMRLLNTTHNKSFATATGRAIQNGDANIVIPTTNINFAYVAGTPVDTTDLQYEVPEGAWFRLDPAYILPTAGDTFNQTAGAKYPELAGNLGQNPTPTTVIDQMHIMIWTAMQKYGFFFTDGGTPTTLSSWDINVENTPYSYTTIADWNTRVLAQAPNTRGLNTSAVGSQSFYWVAGADNNANTKNPLWTGPWLPAPASRFNDARGAGPLPGGKWSVVQQLKWGTW